MTFLDQIENQATDQLKVPNPLFCTSLMKEDSSKDLLEKKEATKMTSIKEPEQGTNYKKIHFYVQIKYFPTYIFGFTYLDRIENQATDQLKVPNPLFSTSLMKEDSSKDLLEKKVAIKMTSIQEPEQGTYDQKTLFYGQFEYFPLTCFS